MTEVNVKEEVRRFYDSVGWREIGEGVYQNARYEDLRPVSQEYLHRCHMRVAEQLPREGTYLLDAGSGPVQYPEYLTYADGYRYRVCLDISHRALVEARERVGAGGLYVVGDVAHPPFRSNAFRGVVSLHAIHHLPAEEHEAAFRAFYRVLEIGGRSVTVYSWGAASPLMHLFRWPIRAAFAAIKLWRRLHGMEPVTALNLADAKPGAEELVQRAGTFTYKHSYRWVWRHLADLPGFEIRVWRAVSAQFLRAFIHQPLFGGYLLRILFALEERMPRLFGRIGQYPMILFDKPAALPATAERSR